MDFISIKDGLPKLDGRVGLTSKTVLFMVDGLVYCGHYHSNGFFYCDEKSHDGLFYGMGLGVDYGYAGMGKVRPVTHWKYLRGD